MPLTASTDSALRTPASLRACLVFATAAVITIALAAGSSLLGSVAGAQELAGPRLDVSCEDRNGRFDFTLPNETAQPIVYSLTVLGDTRTGTIEPGETETEVVTGLPDGDYAVEVAYDAQILGPLEVTVTCDVGLPHVVNAAATCLADRGRVDITITNASDAPTTFVVDVGGVVKEITIEGDGTGIVTVTGRPNGTIPISLSAPSWTATASVTINCDPAQTASLTGFCAGGSGQLAISMFNPAQRTITYTVSLTGQEPETRTLANGENATVNFVGLADGEYLGRVTAPGLPSRSFPLRGLYCATEDPGVGALVTTGCLADRGRIDVWVRNSAAESLDITVDVSGLSTRTASVESGRERPATTVTGRIDGTYAVEVNGPGLTTSASVEVECDGAENPTEPTVASSCLAGRGRIDVRLPNTTDSDILYRVEFPGLAPRERLVPAMSTGRITITGRLDNTYNVLVFADATEIVSAETTVSCMPA